MGIIRGSLSESVSTVDQVLPAPLAYTHDLASDALRFLLFFLEIRSIPIQLGSVELLVECGRDAKHLFVCGKLIPRCVGARPGSKRDIVSSALERIMRS